MGLCTAAEGLRSGFGSFYPLPSEVQGDIGIALSICSLICPSYFGALCAFAEKSLIWLTTNLVGELIMELPRTDGPYQDWLTFGNILLNLSFDLPPLWIKPPVGDVHSLMAFFFHSWWKWVMLWYGIYTWSRRIDDPHMHSGDLTKWYGTLFTVPNDSHCSNMPY